ncbi:hypothetical protein EJB05_06381 [Eragrostis curvula]|uniref:Uncharacterized protein n=1 Tax=Eragrostis curvula TaxID=38414 RepID=A0A5J9WDM8_9POAL|nr:hypothetical protein EJB05_06381 [Eragrostis curvula]
MTHRCQDEQGPPPHLCSRQILTTVRRKEFEVIFIRHTQAEMRSSHWTNTNYWKYNGSNITDQAGAHSSLAERMPARSGFRVPKLSMPFSKTARAARWIWRIHRKLNVVASSKDESIVAMDKGLEKDYNFYLISHYILMAIRQR